MTERVIEPGSLLHGLLNSDFDGWLLYRYDELLKVYEGIFIDGTPEKNRRFISMFTVVLNRRIADNNRVIRDLQIYLENEQTAEGFISLNRIKYNNLLSVNEKSECLIRDLERFKVIKGKQKRESQLTKAAMGLFCQLINASGLMELDADESEGDFCARVCGVYALPYTDKVRQEWSKTATPKNIKKLHSLLFPTLDDNTRTIITEYLARTGQPKSK